MPLPAALPSSTIVTARFQTQNLSREPALTDHSQPPTQPYPWERRFSRYRLDARIQASVFRDEMSTVFWGRTSELGLDGIGATLSGELRPGEVVSLQFPIPLPPHVMEMRAVVRYSQGLHCGFEFLVISDEQRMTLRQVCVLLANAS
jgi:hypothetical protein